MKRYFLLFSLFLLILTHSPTIFAAGPSSDKSVYDAIHTGQKSPSQTTQNRVIDDGSSPSIFPILVKFILSFVFVIVLLVVLLRFLSKRTRLSRANGPILPIGSYMLGNNRSVQMILIGQMIYIVGVGDSINLLCSIPQGEEYQFLLNEYEKQAEGFSKWPGSDPQKMWKKVLNKYIQKMGRENGEE